jgi:hypothetical protein
MTTYEVKEFEKQNLGAYVARLAHDPGDSEGGPDQMLELQRTAVIYLDGRAPSSQYSLTIYKDYGSRRNEDATFWDMSASDVQRLARSLGDLVGSVQPEDVAEGEASPVLGPVYFAARRWADGLVPAYQEGAFAAIVRRAAEQFLAELQEGAENYVLADVSSNVQGHVWHLVDRIVEDGIIGGTPWVVQRYGLGERYQCQALRVALAEKCRDVLVPMVAQRLRDEADQALQSRDWYRRQSDEKFTQLTKLVKHMGEAAALLARAAAALDNAAHHSLLWDTLTAEHAGGLRDEIRKWIEQGRSS